MVAKIEKPSFDGTGKCNRASLWPTVVANGRSAQECQQHQDLDFWPVVYDRENSEAKEGVRKALSEIGQGYAAIFHQQWKLTKCFHPLKWTCKRQPQQVKIC
jgi:hypothetical protein